jgi:adenylate cyclase
MPERNTGVAADNRIEFRIGINMGDIVVEDGDIFGDGVNVAARLEALAEPGGICVAARVQEDAAGKLDLAFDDIGEQQLKNITRPVRVYRVVTEARPERLRPGTDPPLPDKPSIAVLPFANMSGDPEQEYFADGMVEEIITALSRIRWLFVIARNSSFTYKGQAVDVKQVGRELGVRYVLEGSVRKAAGRVRITAQLIDALGGTHLWADRFDGSLEDIFDLQDRVALSVAGVIEPTLQAAEMRRSAGRPTTDLGAYDLYLRALAALFPITKGRTLDALGLLEQAIAIDRHYGPALSWASFCHGRLVTERWTEDIPPQGRRSRSAGAPGGGERPGHSRQRGPRTGVFRRGHRSHDRAGRPCTRAQPELRPRLECEWHSPTLGRPTRSRNRARRDLAAAEPARAYGHAAIQHRCGLFPQAPV